MEVEILKKARHSAIQILSRREHSYWGFKQKMRIRGYSEEIIYPIIEEMRSYSYLDEERFVESWVYYKTQKGFGPNRIRAELQSQEISKELIARFIQGEEDCWYELAARQREKHFGEPPVNVKAQAKQSRYLYQRGFTSSQIIQAMRAC